jgi:nucleotide-binding universal stress UspA family protein
MTEEEETIGTILVPHDGTEMSDKALKKAELLARASDSQIILIHIIDDRFIASSDAVIFIKDKTSLEMQT